MSAGTVVWPAVIKFSGDDELTFVRDLDDLNTHPELLDIRWSPGDLLIDAAGKVFTLHGRTERHQRPEACSQSVSLEYMVDLIRRHAANRGDCCISKIVASNTREALALVRDMGSP